MLYWPFPDTACKSLAWSLALRIDTSRRSNTPIRPAEKGMNVTAGLSNVVAEFVLLELSASNAWRAKNRDVTVFGSYEPSTPVTEQERIHRDELKAQQQLPLERVRTATSDTPDTGLLNTGFLLSLPTISFHH